MDVVGVMAAYMLVVFVVYVAVIEVCVNKHMDKLYFRAGTHVKLFLSVPV